MSRHLKIVESAGNAEQDRTLHGYEPNKRVWPAMLIGAAVVIAVVSVWTYTLTSQVNPPLP